MSHAQKNLLLFFDRPTEPILLEKGDNKARFILPDDYYPEEYNALKTPSEPTEEMTARMAPFSFAENENTDDRIDVKKISIPDMSLAMELPLDEHFSFFVPKHSQMAGQLIDIFMSMPSLEELLSIFAYCQLRINPYLFNYCVTVTLLHRPDTRGMDIPTFADTFPDKFVDRKTLRKARENCALFAEGKIPVIKVELPEVKTPEQQLAYFREDVGLNSHHWHWHLIYPNMATHSIIVNKDRRGELFYYMHHQIMARYNTERFCNGLGRSKPYDNFREPIAEGYFPLLDSSNASRAWTPRFDNLTAHNVNRPTTGTKILISDMEKWYDRILAAVESQSILQENGSPLPLDEETGIDILGNIMESSSISINPNFYGDYHNRGHMLIAYVHDPDEIYSQQHSVMGDSATAMRDPIFYRWHAWIDDIFTTYKDKLTPYGPDKLVFPDTCVSSINIEGVSGRNNINTLWERSTMNLKNALDFGPSKNVYAEMTHLQHEEFNYVIEVNNTSYESRMGTVRIFMAPIEDERGTPLPFDEQRKLMIEMDKFSYPLSPGNNTIRRCSVDSSVTIPFERIFRDHSKESSEAATSSFCDCGWPQNLLVPKGNTKGYPVVMFVMVSNWHEDKVERDLTGAKNDNASYCGLRDQKYPDKRAMGFPFDRKPAQGIDSLGKFVQPNMAFKNCTIKFTDRTRSRGETSDQPKEEHHIDTSGQHPCGVGGVQCNPREDARQCHRPSHIGPGDAQCGPHKTDDRQCQWSSHSRPGDSHCNNHMGDSRPCHRPSHFGPGDAQCGPHKTDDRQCQWSSHSRPGDSHCNNHMGDSRPCHRPSHFGPGDAQCGPHREGHHHNHGHRGGPHHGNHIF